MWDVMGGGVNQIEINAMQYCDEISTRSVTAYLKKITGACMRLERWFSKLHTTRQRPQLSLAVTMYGGRGDSGVRHRTGCGVWVGAMCCDVTLTITRHVNLTKLQEQIMPRVQQPCENCWWKITHDRVKSNAVSAHKCFPTYKHQISYMKKFEVFSFQMLSIT